MPKVECFEIPGLLCWFWSHDHNPPHFHVKKEGEWEIRVRFTEADMFELIWGDEPSCKIMRKLEEAVRGNRDNLLAEWEAKVNQ
jgi:hypothetical protein